MQTDGQTDIQTDGLTTAKPHYNAALRAVKMIPIVYRAHCVTLSLERHDSFDIMQSTKTVRKFAKCDVVEKN